MNKTTPASGQYGFIADVQPQELPPNAWSFAQNMRFRDGAAEKVGGSTAVLTTPAVAPYFITPFRNLNSKFWVYCGLAKVYCDDGTTRTDITAVGAPTGAIDDRWTGGSAEGVLVLNNGKDQPVFWGGVPATPCAILTGWNANWRAASLRPFKNYLVGLDITKVATRYANMVKWSAAAVPGSLPASWDETDATKDAGEVDLAETTDQLIDQMVLGDINVIYKQNSMYGMQYIGGQQIFRFFRLPGEVGMMARGCVASTPKGHVVLTAGDVILHTGQGPQSIVSGRDRKWLFNNMDQTNFARSFLCVNYAKNEVWICFPESGQATCTLALVWNWQDDEFGVRQLQNTTYGASGQISTTSSSTWASDGNPWSTDTTTWNNDGFSATENRLLLTQTDPLIVQAETGGTFNGTTITSILERTGLAFDAPDEVKTVRSIVPRIDAAPGTVLTIQLGASMDAEVGPLYGPPITYTVGTTRKADGFATGRFLAVRISGTSAQPWRLKSYDLDFSKRGYF